MQRVNKFGGPGPRQDRRAQRRKEAEDRLLFWQELTPGMRLESLDAALGKGLGAKRQRARLAKEMRHCKAVIL